ncbi:MAG: periplasmic protein CpxP/Spy [Acidobacteriota bacterium]|nr:periplasmic protein CpxP/Spy [Acidobacteriota bacterium]
MKTRYNTLPALPLLLMLAFASRASAQGVALGQQQSPAPSAVTSQEQTPQPNQGQLELIRALNLTPEQRAQIAQIRQETEEQSRQINVRVRRARRALEQAIYADHADESVVQQRSKDVADAEAARVQMRADAELKVRRVLTPEQFATFRELRRQAQVTQRRQQNNPDATVAQRPAARQQSRNAARAGVNASTVPSLIPRRQRQPAANRRTTPRP